MRPVRRFALARAFAVAALAALVAGSASAADRPWRIVVLSASDPTLPAFVQIDRGVRAVVFAPGGHPVELYQETLDTLRFPGAAIEAEVLALLRKKYADLPVDAVIAAAPGALAFAERYRQRLWPDAVVVFHTVPEEALRGATLSPRTTGILARFDFLGTVELALRLRPGVRRVVMIAGNADFDRSLLAIASEQLAPLAGRIAIDAWTDRPVDEITTAVARLPFDTVVLYLSIFRDSTGAMFVPRDVAGRLGASSSVPVVGVFETFVGNGATMSLADDFEGVGSRAARLALDVLGAPPGAPLPRPVLAPVACYADARELARWRIDRGLLPPACTIRFGEPTVLQRYWWQIALGVAIILSQSVLIAALVIQRRWRQRAEHDTHAARSELLHATRLASMGEITASIAHEIKQPLSAILAHADTAELLLDADAPPVAELQRIVARIRSDDLRASDVITRLRDLLGKHAMERKDVDVNGAIADTLRIVEAEARRRDVSIAMELELDLPPVPGDRAQLQQVVLNLLLNAMDAVAPLTAGARRIVVRTATRAGGVEIEVSDNGPGIDPHVASRLFTSFVTTKAHGLGLGLSIARTIVEAHGGRISVDSPPGAGATFRVALPLESAAARDGLDTMSLPLASSP